MLNICTERYSSAVGDCLRISVCEKPLSTIASEIDVKNVIMAITPKSSGISRLATMMLTTICRSIVPAFSDMLHTTPLTTLFFKRPPAIA